MNSFSPRTRHTTQPTPHNRKPAPRQPRIRLALTLLLSATVGAAVVPPAPAQADVLNFQVNISATEGLNDPAALRFVLSGNTLDSNNSVTLSNFDFGTTGVGGTVTSGSPTISDNNNINRFSQNFTPGDSLSFNLALNTDSADVSGDANGTTDLFTLGILNGTDRSAPRLMTTAPDTVSFFTFNFNSLTNPTFASYQSTPTDAAGNAQPVLVATVTAVTAVPEPTTMALMLCGLTSLAAAQKKRKAGLSQSKLA